MFLSNIRVRRSQSFLLFSFLRFRYSVVDIQLKTTLPICLYSHSICKIFLVVVQMEFFPTTFCNWVLLMKKAILSWEDKSSGYQKAFFNVDKMLTFSLLLYVFMVLLYFLCQDFRKISIFSIICFLSLNFSKGLHLQ